jgi:excisionase family DNA binding protein
MRYSEDIVGVNAAADWLSVHPKTVLRYIRDGRLPAVRIGKSYRIALAALETLLGAPSVRQEPVRQEPVRQEPVRQEPEGVTKRVPNVTPDAVDRSRVTCIVEVPESSSASAAATVAFLNAAVQAAHQVRVDTGRRTGQAPFLRPRLQLDTAFDALAGQLRVVLIGALDEVSQLLDLLTVQRRGRNGGAAVEDLT